MATPVPFPTISTGRSIRSKPVSTPLISQCRDTRLCGSVGSCRSPDKKPWKWSGSSGPQRLGCQASSPWGGKRGCYYLPTHKRLLHNLVTSFVGMKFFGASLSRRLPSGNTLENSSHRDSRAMNPAINTAMTTASAASERRAGQPV